MWKGAGKLWEGKGPKRKKITGGRVGGLNTLQCGIFRLLARCFSPMQPDGEEGRQGGLAGLDERQKKNQSNYLPSGNLGGGGHRWDTVEFLGRKARYLPIQVTGVYRW